MPYPFEPGAVRQSTFETVRVQRARNDVEAVNVVVADTVRDVRQRMQDVVAGVAEDVAAARGIVQALVAEAAQARSAFATLNLRLTAIETRLTAVEARLPPIP
jgi:hypothetical protein